MGIKLISGEVRDLFAQNFQEHVQDTKLTKSTNGTRTSSTGGTNPTFVDYECSGFVKAVDQAQIDGTLVLSTDCFVAIFGGSLPEGIEPAPTDKIEIEFPPDTGIIRTFRIVGGNDGKGVHCDPVGAVYTCHCRGA